MKLAIITDKLAELGGAETVLEALLETLPQADLYAMMYNPQYYQNSIISKRLKATSFIQKLPFAKTHYRNYFMLYPTAVEQFDLSKYDVIISWGYFVSHGVITRADQVHIAYSCTPMRQAWSGYFDYINSPFMGGLLGFIKKPLTSLFLHYLRLWDYAAAQRPDHYIAISKEARARISKYYGRDADVIFPHAEVDAFSKYLANHPKTVKKDYYFTISRHIPYKRIDLMIEAFKKLPDKHLKIAGDGPERANLERLADKAPNIEFLGYVSSEDKLRLHAEAKAFLFCAHEDFGIVAVEAQAAGTPVIAFGKGGVKDTVVDGKTGVFFNEQTPESLIAAINQFEKLSMEGHFKQQDLLESAGRFGKERFKKEILEHVTSKLCDR
ncbi:glycosyltransferase [Candidatus Dojkabacteria bacterium]|nr:glycosyltransferase [Candidatus Dojkabacteria bacterium]